MRQWWCKGIEVFIIVKLRILLLNLLTIQYQNCKTICERVTDQCVNFIRNAVDNKINKLTEMDMRELLRKFKPLTALALPPTCIALIWSHVQFVSNWVDLREQTTCYTVEDVFRNKNELHFVDMYCLRVPIDVQL